MKRRTSNEMGERPNTRQILWSHAPDRDQYSDLIFTSMNSHMLIEDIHAGIIPFSFDDYKSPGRVLLCPASKEIETMICNALPTHYGRSGDLRSMVCGFVRYAAQVLAAYGKLECEIVFHYHNQDRTKLATFELQSVPYGVIHYVAGIPFYFDSNTDDTKKHAYWERVHRIDKENLFVFDLPAEWGSSRRHRRLIGRLARIGQSVMPRFALEEMKPDTASKVFEYDSYRRSYELWIASITKHVGWTARGTYGERTTEYFKLVRHLRMKRQMTLLRTHIIARLNEALLRIGSVVGFDAQIKVEGLPVAAKYDDLMKKLANGELPFAEAWKVE